ncbi:MAG: endonuclease domain-containing protein [Rhizomicrobium sp.]
MRTCAQRMRRLPTEAEKKFWWVRDRRLGGYKFKRQHPIGHYIADFVCVEAKLIVELDGGQHAEQRESDAARERFSESEGFRTGRYWNPEFLKNQDAVGPPLPAILDARKTSSPQPSRDIMMAAKVDTFCHHNIDRIL